jgi:hypothetical protein
MLTATAVQPGGAHTGVGFVHVNGASAAIVTNIDLVNEVGW